MSQEFPQFAQQTLANALNWFSPTHRLWDRVWAAPTEHGRKNKTRNSWRVLRKPRLEMLLDYPHKSRRAYLYALWCISSARYTPYPSVNHPDKTIQHCAQPLPSLSFCGIRFTNLSRNQWGEIADSVLRLEHSMHRRFEFVPNETTSGWFVNSPISTIWDRKLRENGARFRLDSPETFGE